MTIPGSFHTAAAINAIEKDRLRLIGEVEKLKKENHVLRTAMVDLMGVARSSQPVDERTERYTGNR